MGCPEETSNSLPMSNSEPYLASFVLYAERSIRLGECCRVQGGNIGVHAVGGIALRISAHNRRQVDHRHMPLPLFSFHLSAPGRDTRHDP